MTWTDWLVTGLSIMFFLLWTLWITWRLEPTWKAFEGMIEMIAVAMMGD